MKNDPMQSAHPFHTPSSLAAPRSEGPSLHRRGKWAAFAVTLALFGGITTGCKDQAKCDEAVATTRKAITVEDMALARQWRDYTWKACGDKALIDTIDGEIVGKVAEMNKRLEDAALKAKELAEGRLKKAQALWKKFDKLDEKKQTTSSLKKTNSQAKRLLSGLEPDYQKQVKDYNAKQYKTRLAKLKKKD
jgi:hypothetical protein